MFSSSSWSTVAMVAVVSTTSSSSRIRVRKDQPSGSARRSPRSARLVLGERRVDADAVGLHDVGQAVRVHELVTGEPASKKKTAPRLTCRSTYGCVGRVVAEIDGGDAPHGEAVEVPEHRLDDGDLLAQAVEHPVAGAVELDDHGAHLLRRWLRRRGSPRAPGGSRSASACRRPRPRSRCLARRRPAPRRSGPRACRR